MTDIILHDIPYKQHCDEHTNAWKQDIQVCAVTTMIKGRYCVLYEMYRLGKQNRRQTA